MNIADILMEILFLIVNNVKENFEKKLSFIEQFF